MKLHDESILVVGDEKLAFSIAACLLQGEHAVTLSTRNREEAFQTVEQHCSDIRKQGSNSASVNNLDIIENLPGHSVGFKVAVVITEEDVALKRSMIRRLEQVLSADAIIAINSESISLGDIQQGALVPARLIGVNWTEPAHTTRFLEVIVNTDTRQDFAEHFVSLARARWKKDPYVLPNGVGIRSRMMSAMIREAFFLIENGYVGPEDIDRACRNDPGYYLPFAGHCRYMDLMGTFIYGVVMKDLNPELAKDRHFPDFVSEILEDDADGMKNGKGFYKYSDGEALLRSDEFRRFSYEIQQIIDKYPFKNAKTSPVKKNLVSDI